MEDAAEYFLARHNGDVIAAAQALSEVLASVRSIGKNFRGRTKMLKGKINKTNKKARIPYMDAGVQKVMEVEVNYKINKNVQGDWAFYYDNGNKVLTLIFESEAAKGLMNLALAEIYEDMTTIESTTNVQKGAQMWKYFNERNVQLPIQDSSSSSSSGAADAPMEVETAQYTWTTAWFMKNAGPYDDSEERSTVFEFQAPDNTMLRNMTLFISALRNIPDEEHQRLIEPLVELVNSDSTQNNTEFATIGSNEVDDWGESHPITTGSYATYLKTIKVDTVSIDYNRFGKLNVRIPFSEDFYNKLTALSDEQKEKRRAGLDQYSMSEIRALQHALEPEENEGDYYYSEDDESDSEY